MIPQALLYPIGENLRFNRNGERVWLNGCLSATIFEDKNYISGGEYYLEIEYSRYGDFSPNIRVGTVIFAKNQSYDEEQIFIVTEISKGFETINIHAEHWSYILSKMVMRWNNTGTLQDLFAYMNRFPYLPFSDLRFNFQIEGTTPTQSISQSAPITMLEMLGGVEGSVLDIYGGDIVFDGTSVKWTRNRGKDSNYMINYGLNILNYAQNIELGNIARIIDGYVKKNDDSYVIARVLNTNADLYYGNGSTFNFETAIDFSSQFSDVESVTEAMLSQTVRDYITKNNASISNIDASFDIDMYDLKNSLGYKNMQFMDDLKIGDRVNVYVPIYDLQYNDDLFDWHASNNLKMTVNRIEYDVLKETITNVGLGKPKLTMTDAIVSVSKKENKSAK